MSDSITQRELLMESAQKQFATFEQRLSERLNKMDTDKKEQDKKLTAIVEQKTSIARADLEAEIVAREAETQSINASIEV